jgi:hypothetical protein
MESSTVTPSPGARKLFNMMVVRAEPAGDDLHLSLARAIELTVVINRRGDQAMMSTAMTELQEADWISPAVTGGWKVS